MSDVEKDGWIPLALARIDEAIVQIERGSTVETTRTACLVCKWTIEKNFQDGIKCPTGRWNLHFPSYCPAATSCRVFVRTVQHKFWLLATKIKRLRRLRQEVEEHIL